MRAEEMRFEFEKGGVLPEDHWFKIVERLYEESGEIPDPLQIRASAIIEAFGIPSGPYSALEVEEGERISPERDRIIAEYLTNKPGLLIEEGIVSHDFRDLYPEGLPKELKRVLNEDTLAIMEIEYRHQEEAKKRFERTEDFFEADCPVHYFRLPSGIDLFLRGYTHKEAFHKKHKHFFQKVNRQAKVICIEGFADEPFGMSLDLSWSDPKAQRGDYDALMHEAVKAGFKGFFTEIDARDESKIKMDSMGTILPPKFFEKYFNYLQRERLSLTKHISFPEKLKEAFITQSTTENGIETRAKTMYWQGKLYSGYPYLSKEGEVSFEPTFLELGQHLFTDALASLKLHLIAKLMADGHIEKGPIIDYEGAGHSFTKPFFLNCPEYAMEVVLRTVNELMAGKVENLPEIYEIFENPNWPEIVKEIAKLVFKSPKKGKLVDKPIDFLKIYNLDSQRIIPTDEEIEAIREKLSSEKIGPTLPR